MYSQLHLLGLSRIYEKLFPETEFTKFIKCAVIKSPGRGHHYCVCCPVLDTMVRQDDEDSWKVKSTVAPSSFISRGAVKTFQ